MMYLQDGGVSAVRFYLSEPEHPLARFAAAALTVPYHDAGLLVCVCNAPAHWSLGWGTTDAELGCVCNGSSLPIYIGPPYGFPHDRSNLPTPRIQTHSCPDHPGATVAAAIAIGYANEVPELGTVDAERAQEIVVACSCLVEGAVDPAHAFVGWSLRLPAPYPVAGDEPWLKTIHTLRRT